MSDVSCSDCSSLETAPAGTPGNDAPRANPPAAAPLRPPASACTDERASSIKPLAPRDERMKAAEAAVPTPGSSAGRLWPIGW